MNRHNTLMALTACTSMMLAACSSGPAEPTGDWLAFETLVLPTSPNTALACTPEVCTTADASRPPIALDASPVDVLAALSAAVPRLETLPADETGRIRARYVDTTAIMKFRDDVDVLLVPDQEGAATMMMVYSRSRVGHSDMGKNAERITSLEAELQALLGA